MQLLISVFFVTLCDVRRVGVLSAFGIVDRRRTLSCRRRRRRREFTRTNSTSTKKRCETSALLLSFEWINRNNNRYN